MATIASHVNGSATSSDWQDRYLYIDQILDRPGPRTDPSFLAGDEVWLPLTQGYGSIHTFLRSKTFLGTSAKSWSSALAGWVARF